MPGYIALVGGDEFRPGCEEMDREIMRASGQNPARVVVIPTAAVNGAAKAASNGVRYFSSLGGDPSQLMVMDKGHADSDEYAQAVAEAGVIYFTGGSPDHLLATLRGSRLLEVILETVDKGAVLAGSSAGAMVLGSLMRQPSSGQWVEGVSVVPAIAVLPHHEGKNPAETSIQLRNQVPSDLTVLGIDARGGCLGQSGNWRVVGSGNVTVYRGANWYIYRPGERILADF